jgi:branched-subunit amino acid aminotransferase/4-amino-4-deoxychorismate lyase
MPIAPRTMATKITVVHCWSAPRSRSTALLYSFEARGSNTIALDEPLYRRWLQEKGKNVGISRPYAEPFLAGTAPSDEDADDAWRWEREKQCLNERIYHSVNTLLKSENNNDKEGVIFAKEMAKFASLFDFETNWESDKDDSSQWRDKCLKLLSENNVQMDHKHMLLIRDPISVLGSWMNSSDVHGSNPHPDEIGITQLLDVYAKAIGGNHAVVVIDSDDLADEPCKSLQELCSALNIGYDESMLHWEAGVHECDGPWNKWWYHNVWKSSGWDADGDNGGNGSRQSRYRTVPPDLLPALRLTMPAYTFLQTLTASHKNRALTTPPSGKLYEDPRNEHVLVYVGTPGRKSGNIIPRELAKISPFDSSVQGGDATWEGIRIYNGRVFHLDHHLNRLFRSAKALGFENVHSRKEIRECIFRVLAANGMRDGAHMRLTLTRGEKCTSSMNPYFNVYGTTLIILPEWKPTEGATTYDNQKGISLITAGACRRSPPSTLDNKIHHNNMIQNILPKIQANLAGAADSIMLDTEGFVSETNATNLFMVRCDSNCHAHNGLEESTGEDDCSGAVLITPTADHCLPGITRDTVLILAKELGIKYEVRRVSLSEFYAADEVFTTGTMGELTPVTKIDGRVIGSGKKGVLTERLQQAYKRSIETRLEWSTEIPPFC